MRSEATGFSAVVMNLTRQWVMWFLRGEEAARIDTQALQWQKPLTEAFDGAFAALPEPFVSCSDGAFDINKTGTGWTVFLAGDQRVEWQWGAKAIYQGPITGYPGLGPHIPGKFHSDIDIAMQLPTVSGVRRTMLIKGDQSAIVKWGQGVSYQGPLPGMPEAGWKMLPEDMSGDFDHTVLYAPSGGALQTLFLKGDQAMHFDWNTGPKQVGSWGQVLAGLGKLPAAYQQPRLPAAPAAGRRAVIRHHRRCAGRSARRSGGRAAGGLRRPVHRLQRRVLQLLHPGRRRGGRTARHHRRHRAVRRRHQQDEDLSGGGHLITDNPPADHPDHHLAVYTRMVKGANAGRHFLTLGQDGIEVRPADTDTSIEQLGTVVETTLAPGPDAGVDNITLNETMRRLARAHARAGDLKQADIVLDQLVDTFRDKEVPAPVLATLVEQAETARAQLHDHA
jgi:hypothetical protein